MDPKVLLDSGWKYSLIANPSIGYHDFERAVTFKEGIAEVDQTNYIRSVMDAAKGMWNNVIQVDFRTWHLTYGYDSGD